MSEPIGKAIDKRMTDVFVELVNAELMLWGTLQDVSYGLLRPVHHTTQHIKQIVVSSFPESR